MEIVLLRPSIKIELGMFGQDAHLKTRRIHMSDPSRTNSDPAARFFDNYLSVLRNIAEK